MHKVHPELKPTSIMIRKGSFRFLGPILWGMAGIAVFLITRSQSASPIAWAAPVLFILGGLWFFFRDTRYVLFRNENCLIWVRCSGSKREGATIDIEDICKIEIFRMRPANRKVATSLQVELVKKDGSRSALPRDIGLGGPGNPRYDDLIKELKAVNASIDVEIKDVEGWRHWVKY